MSSNNTIRARGRGRGIFRSKYGTRSNLHIIATHVPTAPSSKKKHIPKNVKKETILVPASNKSSKNCSVGQQIKSSAVTNKDPGSKTESALPKAESGSPKTASVLAKTETDLSKMDSVAQKKEESQKSISITRTFTSDTTRKERQASYAKSNFLMLHNLDKSAPKSKTSRPKNVFFPQVRAVANKTITTPQNVGKPVKKEPVQNKKFDIQNLKTKPSQTKISHQEFNKNQKELSHLKADKPEGKNKQFLNKNTTQYGKKLPHDMGDFTGQQGSKKKARLDTSSDFESHKRKELSFWKEGSNSGRAYFLSEQEEVASRKKPHTSRDYLKSLEDEMYYKNKHKKSKKKDYKCKESEPYSAYDKYNWYSKDYKLKQKYSEEQYAFNEYSEEGDFEEVEDFEEVASVESKVPVHFRKCVVRYLPYRTFSYFRPKWYYLSRKRYIVNCLYATGKEGKITAEERKDTKSHEDRIMDENLIETAMEVPEESLDNFEMLEVIPDDDIVAEEVSVHDDETISDDVSVHDEIISDEVSVHDETISDEVAIHDETISDEVSVDDSVEKNLGVTKKTNTEPTSMNKDIEVHNKTVKLSDVKVNAKEVQAVKNTGNQTANKKLSHGKGNYVTLIDLCSDNPKTRKRIDRNSSFATSNSGTLEKPEIIVKKMNIEVIDLEENDAIPEKSERNSATSKKDLSNIKAQINDMSSLQASTKEFLKCNSSLTFPLDFKQGVAFIQNDLAKWKSHLIGLEYMLEILAVDEAVVKKYHCGLCDVDIPVEKAGGQNVINHVISYKHMCNYMAKHFPSSDYKFSKSVRSYISEIVLQKCCEEINSKLGYHFMCIVKEDYFQKDGDKVKDYFNAMKHFSEADINIDPISVLNHLESNAEKDIARLIDDMMRKILIDEENNSFFTPKTIVSTLRRSNVKDKKKDLSKTIENAVGRCSQNALILLTPEYSPLLSSEVLSIKTTLPELKTPEKLIAPPKPARELRSNLLQVHVHDSSNIKEPNKQPVGAASSLNSIKNTTDKKVIQKNIPIKEECHLENIEPFDHEGENNNQDTEKSNAKTSEGFRKYTVQESTPTPVTKTAESENEAVRIVRIRTITNRSVKLKFDEEDEDTPVYLTDSNVHDKKENDAEKEPELFNTDSINTGDTDILQGEDISDNDFSDHDFVEVSSTGVEMSAHKSKSRIKQHSHQKGPHSKFCRKRIYRGKESSTDQDSAFNDLNISGNVIPTVDKFKGKHFSTFVKRSDELSLDSSVSSSSRRKRSPLRLSRSPSLEEFLRKLSRSPKRSKSPLRVPRIPFRKRSPLRRHSRSPYRRYSRSPRKRQSRSPYRKRSRSPIRRRSRSPFRKRSRTPPRKRSRSPIRRRSRSPYRRHSRSPRRRISRSPIRKRSRSPIWSASMSQSIHKSRSPYRKIGGRKISRSPERIASKLPARKISKSPTRRSKSPARTYPHSRSPLRSDSKLPKDSQSYKSDSLYKYKKDSARSSGSFDSTSKSSTSHRHKERELGHEINDLDEVSDEDESKYFSTSTDNPVYMEIIKKLPESARIMLVKVLQRFSITNINPNDPSFFELMKFVASHSTEIQRLMSQPSVLSEMNAPMHGNPVPSQESLVHEYLLSGMKQNLKNLSVPGESFPSISGTPSASADIRFQQPPVPSTSGLQFLPPSSGLSPNPFQPSSFQQLSSQPQYPIQNMQHLTPPQVHPQQVYSNPPVVHQQQQPHFQPDKYQTPSPRKPASAPRTKVQSEVMFKDLKATVNKIFGGDDVLGRIGIKIPGFNDGPSQDKWGTNPPSVQKMNTEPQTSFQSNRSGMNFHNINEVQTRASDNVPKNYSKINEPYFEDMSRQEPHVPPPDAKVSFCDVQRSSSQRNLFPVVNNPDTIFNYSGGNSQMSVNDAKKSLAQRLAAVLVKVGMTDVPAYLLQEMLMKIGAFSLNPPQDISEEEIIGILRKLKYL